jgi:hypothetical protein
MSATQKSALNQFFNQHGLTLLAGFLLTVSHTSIADSESTTNNMPVPESQGIPVQEMLVKETPDTKTLTEKKRGKVARAIFTSEIIDREPADDLTDISNSSDRIYFYTDLRNLTGQIVTHRWEYNDKIMAEVKFKVGGGPRWRVYSSKNLLPEWTGVWTVIVTDEDGQTLNTSVFNYTQATKTAEAPTAPEQQAPE